MNDVHQLAAAYALDALDDDERSTFEAHLAGCADCTAEVEGFTATAALLGRAAAQTPPPSLRDRIMAEVATTRQDDVLRPAPAEPIASIESSPSDVAAPVVSLDAARRRRTRVMAVLGAAAAVVVVAVVGVVLSNRDGVSTDDVLAAADVQVITLADAVNADAASVQVAWSRELDRAVVAGDDLAAPGADLVYELWAIVDGTPRPAGLISHDGGSLSELLDLEDLDGVEVAAWGITIEPEGGSAAPTPPILYYAEV